MFEMATEGKPLVLTNWSSYLDFLNVDGKDYFLPVDYKLMDVAQDSYMKDIILPGFKWAYPEEFSFKSQMREVYENYETHKQTALELKNILKRDFTPEKIYVDMIHKMFASFGNIELSNATNELEVLTYE